jgi:putative MATE family efflux protein
MNPTVFNKEFINAAVKIAFPVAILSVLQSSFSIVDQMMVGQLNEAAIAAVSLGSKFIYLYYALIYAIASGTSIFIAQYWGSKEKKSFDKILASSILICVTLGTLSIFLVWNFGEHILQIYTPDTEVIALGARYQMILLSAYLPAIPIALYSGVLRCTGSIKYPVYLGIVSLALNSGLNWVLIFGNWGFPELGVTGAALATGIAKMIEAILFLYILHAKKMPGILSVRRAFTYYHKEFVAVCKVSVPIILMSITFTLADSLYSSIYGHMSTASIVAISIVMPFQGFMIAFFTGISTAAATLIGLKIGDDDLKNAFQYAVNFLVLGLLLSILAVLFLAPAQGAYLRIYDVSNEVIQMSESVFLVVFLFLSVKVLNMILMQGILPTGGQTKQLFYINLAGQWLLSLPAGYICAFYFDMPIFWVLAIVSIEELLRCIYCYRKMLSKTWITKLA